MEYEDIIVEKIRKKNESTINDIKKIESRGVNSIALKGQLIKNKKEVFIKVFSPEAEKRQQREIEAYKMIDNPYVVKLFEDDEIIIKDKKYPYGIFEWVKGKELSKYIEEELGKDWDNNLIIDILGKLIIGMKAIWEKNLIHRDIKPDNIKVNELKKDGNIEILPKILDLGLAKHLDKSSITSPGSRPGTDIYKSPEQILGKDIDKRSDQFSLGITMYEFITGYHPFNKGTNNIINEVQEDIRNYKKDLHIGLVNIINKMLKKEPFKRYKSADDILEEIEIAEVRLRHQSKKKIKQVFNPNKAGFLILKENKISKDIILGFLNDKSLNEIKNSFYGIVIDFTTNGKQDYYKKLSEKIKDYNFIKILNHESFILNENCKLDRKTTTRFLENICSISIKKLFNQPNRESVLLRENRKLINYQIDLGFNPILPLYDVITEREDISMNSVLLSDSLELLKDKGLENTINIIRPLFFDINFLANNNYLNILGEELEKDSIRDYMLCFNPSERNINNFKNILGLLETLKELEKNCVMLYCEPINSLVFVSLGLISSFVLNFSKARENININRTSGGRNTPGTRRKKYFSLNLLYEMFVKEELHRITKHRIFKEIKCDCSYCSKNFEDIQDFNEESWDDSLSKKHKMACIYNLLNKLNLMDYKERKKFLFDKIDQAITLSDEIIRDSILNKGDESRIKDNVKYLNNINKIIRESRN